MVHLKGRFTAAERKGLDAVLERCCEVLRVYLHRGVDAAATCANGKAKAKDKAKAKAKAKAKRR